MPTFKLTMAGTITRDIIRVEVDADDETSARAIAARDLKTYRIDAITMQHNWVPSTLGHGEVMCTQCKITNREAACLGWLERCKP